MKTPVISQLEATCHKCEKSIQPGEPRVELGSKTSKCNTCYLTEKYGDKLPKYRAA